MLKTVYGSTKSACGYTFFTSTRLRQVAFLAILYHSDIGPSTDGSTAAAPRHALLLMTRICACILLRKVRRRKHELQLPCGVPHSFAAFANECELQQETYGNLSHSTERRLSGARGTFDDCRGRRMLGTRISETGLRHQPQNSFVLSSSPRTKSACNRHALLRRQSFRRRSGSRISPGLRWRVAPFRRRWGRA